jgi:hypothetical protein
MAVDIDGDLDGMMAQLIPNVRQALAVLDEQRRVGVAKIMNPDSPEPGLL